jgi:hypothetical protein
VCCRLYDGFASKIYQATVGVNTYHKILYDAQSRKLAATVGRFGLMSGLNMKLHHLQCIVEIIQLKIYTLLE